MDKKLSIITVCYNSEATIRKTFDSVLQQVDEIYEYIIVDGASKDSTIDIIKEYEPRFGGKMKWKSEPDGGIYSAFNKGIERCSGDIIGIINSDDWYEQGAFVQVKAAMTEDPYQVVYGMCRYIDAAGVEMYVNMYSHNYLRKNMINHPSCFVTKATYEKFGGFDTKYKCVADYDLMLRFFETKQVVFTPVYSVWANFAVNGASYTYKGAKEKYDFQKEKGLISKPEYIYRVAGLKGLDIYKKLKHE